MIHMNDVHSNEFLMSSSCRSRNSRTVHIGSISHIRQHKLPHTNKSYLKLSQRGKASVSLIIGGAHQQVIRTTATQTGITHPCRLPVINTQSTRDSLNNSSQLLQERLLSRNRERNRRQITRERICRIRARNRPVRLDNHDILSVRRVHILHTGLQRRESSRGAVEGVVGDTHIIKVGGDEVGSGREHLVVEVLLCAPVPAVVKVNHDLGSSLEVGVLHTPGTRVQETGDVIIVGCFAEWPEQAGCDFIAD